MSTQSTNTYHASAGPSIETCSKKPEVVGRVTILNTKVMMPVKKM